MAYENGYNLFDYTIDIFKRYIADNFIFAKALQTIQFYESKHSFPFALNEMDISIEKIIGQSLSTFSTNYVGDHNPLLCWDFKNVQNFNDKSEAIVDLTTIASETTIKNFITEIEAFQIAIKYLCDKIVTLNNHPLGVARIAYLDNNNNQVLRIIRNDDKYIDVYITKNDIEFVINSLTKLLGEEKNV